ncbi:MAG: hypothetical protein E7233_02820 [Lachnospiraceae bacterium]|nr:hypothetical protein [Lachnospiraceae bacterium]
MKKIIPAALLMLALISMPGCMMKRELTVGKDIKPSDITEFYYTIDASTFPPHYQRYRFYIENGKYYFYHETREGSRWPLTEDDATVKGTVELTESGWSNFLDYINAGTVTARKDSAESGDSGPWLFIYWKNDRSKYQVFEFESYEKQKTFEIFCEDLRNDQ